MGAKSCKSLHPGSIPGQASTAPLGESLFPGPSDRARTEQNGRVRDHESRPAPELCSADVLAVAS